MDGTFNNTLIEKIFATLPLAQFKHLPDIGVLRSFTAGGGAYSLNDTELNKKTSRSKSPKISIRRSKTIKK